MPQRRQKKRSTAAKVRRTAMRQEPQPLRTTPDRTEKHTTMESSMSATANATNPSPSSTAMGTQSHTPAGEQTVDAIVKRVDRTKETNMLHRIVALVAAGMLLDGIDVYMASTVPAAHWPRIGPPSKRTPDSCPRASLACSSARCWLVSSATSRAAAWRTS